MDGEPAEAPRRKTGIEIAREIGNDPNSEWWKGLGEDAKKELLKGAIAEKTEAEALGTESKIRFKMDRDLLFASAEEVSTDDAKTIYKEIDRVHYVPNFKAQKLTEWASARFFYNRIDQKRFGFPDPELPTLVRLRKESESSMYMAVDPEAAKKLTGEVDANGAVAGSEMIEYEEADLHPLYNVKNVRNYLSSSLRIVSGGQMLYVLFNPAHGEVYDVKVADFLGRDKNNRGVLTRGMNLTDRSAGRSSLEEVLSGRSVSEGGFNAGLNPETGMIAITKTFRENDGEEARIIPIIEVPRRIDVAKGLQNLFGDDSLERPFDAPMTDDLWRRTKLTDAFGIKFTPLSDKAADSIRALHKAPENKTP